MIFYPPSQGFEVFGALFLVSPSEASVKIKYYLDHPAGVKNRSKRVDIPTRKML